MARYTLKSFLRQTQNSLLKAFFDQKNLLSDFDWYKKAPDGEKTLLPETEIDGLADIIGQPDNNDMLAVSQEFKQIYSLASEDRIFCMIDLGTKSKFGVDLVKEFEADSIESYYDRSMYVYLKHNDLFNYVTKFMEIINTDSGREFEAGPGLKPKVDETSLTTFKQNVIKHYKGKGRGDKCVIDYYHKKGEDEQYCYYIFHEDCVKNVLDFNETGNDLIYDPRRQNFDNVFFFEPKSGNLRIHAGGERNSEELADLFCTHILKLDGRPNQDTKVYDLSKAKNPEFTFPVKSPIETIHLKEIICDMGNDEEIIFKVKGREEKNLLLQKRMLVAVNSYGIAPDDVTITKIRFQVVFKKQAGIKGRRTRTRELVLPNKTNISSDDYFDKVIRRHVEQEWGLKCRLFSQKKSEEAA